MVKRSSKEQDIAKGGSKFDQEKHYVLENIKTGKIASSDNWLNRLAAIAILKDQSSGIMAALPLDRAQRLLQHNKVIEKDLRSKTNNSERERTRKQAQDMLPMLAALYSASLLEHRVRLKTEFCNWIVGQMSDHHSLANKYAQNKGCDDLIDANRTARWWQDQLKKMQS